MKWSNVGSWCAFANLQGGPLLQCSPKRLKQSRAMNVEDLYTKCSVFSLQWKDVFILKVHYRK